MTTTVRSRWLKKYNTARGYADKARARYIARPTKANKTKLLTWRERVASARRVLARHSTTTTVSQAGTALVAAFEGFRSWPYRDAVGVWTIGYGETRGIGPGTSPWTEPYARAQLKRRLNRDYLAPVLKVDRALGLNLKQRELDALASLVYNLGPGILGPGYTMGSALRSKSRSRIANAFLRYNKAGGRTLPGLVRRRNAERRVFLGDGYSTR